MFSCNFYLKHEVMLTHPVVRITIKPLAEADDGFALVH